MRTTYAKLLLAVAGVLGMLVLNACASLTQVEPVEALVQASQPDAITPTSQPAIEVAPRPEGEVKSESTLGFNVSGWS